MSEDRRDHRDFLGMTSTFLSRIDTGLERTAAAAGVPTHSSTLVESARGLLKEVIDRLQEAALGIDRCDLSEDSESDAPCRGTLDALLVYADPESAVGSCVLHAAFALHLLDEVHLVGEDEFVERAVDMARQLADLAPLPPDGEWPPDD